MKLLYSRNRNSSGFTGSSVPKPTAILGFSVDSVEKYKTL